MYPDAKFFKADKKVFAPAFKTGYGLPVKHGGIKAFFIAAGYYYFFTGKLLGSFF
jgi:hypothetical protein